MQEYRETPLVRVSGTRHKLEVTLTIEYNATIPPYPVGRDVFDFTQEKGDKAFKEAAIRKAIEKAINPDYMSQTADCFNLRVVDVRVENIKDIQ